jgi:thiol-disulfide isomerase/thioredoxin
VGAAGALVYFFATWCMPCLMELKTLTALQHQYETKGFSVVAVGMDLEGRRLLAPFAQSYQFPFPVLVASDEVRSGQSPYGTILKVPTTVLLDRQGHVVAAVEGISDPAGLQRTVADLLR